MTAKTSPATRIKARAAAIKQNAQTIDTTRTETVTVADLKPGDVILTLGRTAFPFPFTLSVANTVGTFGVQLKATHGWFTPMPIRFAETATRVVA